MIKPTVIWNITNKCPYTCSFCCVSANEMISPLSLKEKLKIVDNLDYDLIRFDLSGGDPLIEEDNIIILEKLSKKYGEKNVSITTTGIGLQNINLNYLKNHVSEVGITYDFPFEPSSDRPKDYNLNNLIQGQRAVHSGIEVIAQTPLTSSNIEPKIIQRIYRNLAEAEISQILLIRFSESGRGILRRDLAISQNQINEAVRNYKELEIKYGFPRVKLTSSVRGELIGKILTSLNITPEGDLISNPWSYSLNGKSNPSFFMGDLKKDAFSKIAGSSLYEIFLNQIKRNLLT